MKRFASCMLACMLVCVLGLAAADVSYEGTVVGGETIAIQAPFGGRISDNQKRAGDMISEGESLMKINSTKVYAPIEGTVSGLYISEGDKAEDVTERYSASLFIEPTNRYVLSATTDKAYSASENHYIHLGEQVYMRCTTDGTHRGTGLVSALTDKGYNIEVTGGDFYMGEKVDIYRSSDYSKESCIGRGTVDRAKPVAVKGTGSVLKIHVKDGDFVERGELLFETVEGTLDGLYAPDPQVLSPVTGIVSSVDKNNGDNAAKGDTLMKVIPLESLQVQFSVPESDVLSLKEGQKVKMELYWETESGKTYEGKIVAISHQATEPKTDSDRKTYTVYSSINADERIRAGMTVILYVEGADIAEETGHGTGMAEVEVEEPTAETAAAE